MRLLHIYISILLLLSNASSEEINKYTKILEVKLYSDAKTESHRKFNNEKRILLGIIRDNKRNYLVRERDYAEIRNKRYK